MAARYVQPPPAGSLTTDDLLERWQGSITKRTLYTWLRRKWLKGRMRDNRWLVSEAEAARWEQEHPRLRALVQEREAKAKGGAA